MGFINEYESDWPWRILLIEDNAADERMVRKCLARHHLKCDLIVLEDAKRAMSFLDESENNMRQRCPDLILLNIGLPHHDGVDVLKKIRAHSVWGQVPVIVLTGGDCSETYTAAVKHAVKHCFKKTANYDEFLKLGEIIQQVLEAENGSRKE